MTTTVFKKTRGLTDVPFTYCPGCTHGIIHRLVAEVLEELELLDTAVGIASVGCSVMSYEFFNCDMIQAAHGRAPAVATGVKRTHPDKTVFTYQGDGDMASIGAAEIVHAAHRSENITVIFVNNAIYGMTGGQMAPTTLPGHVTTTSPFGRDTTLQGEPIRMSEMLSTIPGSYYIERVTVIDPISVRKAKTAIKKAFQAQKDNKGFSMIEVLSTCNVGWGVTPLDALKQIKNDMIPYYPLGVYKDKGANQ
ncbi:MAG TPA: 2-oxoglutarate oxidoreductase [Erysipelotrichaceae bacterium]|nr:2-oxoglutarate oxidoreductase [Erysipelotrichaceae bacterium]HAO60557.1 2-oxoglutarate oxidoreductase [Erysipelotrichaceae bacterium]